MKRSLRMACSVWLGVSAMAAVSMEAYATHTEQALPAGGRWREVAGAVGVVDWPKSDILRSAPEIPPSVFAEVDPVPVRVNSSVIDFGGHGLWGGVAHGLSRGKGNPVSEAKMVLTPSSRHAQLFMIAKPCVSALPTEGVTAGFTEDRRVENLGDVGFGTVSRSGSQILQFCRDNIWVHVWADKAVSDQALPVARWLDELIQKQPRMTYTQLLARRPGGTIGSTHKVSGEAAPTEMVSHARGIGNTALTVTAPACVDILSICPVLGAVISSNGLIAVSEHGDAEIHVTSSELLVGVIKRTGLHEELTTDVLEGTEAKEPVSPLPPSPPSGQGAATLAEAQKWVLNLSLSRPWIPEALWGLGLFAIAVAGVLVALKLKKAR